MTSTGVQVAAEQICRQRRFSGILLRFGFLIFLVIEGQGCPQILVNLTFGRVGFSLRISKLTNL
jgi:hypothetical protein